MNKAIGIISYLPDDEKKRKIREEKINNLIRTCDEFFDLPIIIIAQNWKDFEISCHQYLIYKFNKPLGIVGARKALREVFLQSEYDYLIMLDDDCNVIGSKEGADNYLKEIDQHPGMFGVFYGTLLKLFAISKEVFALQDYGDGKVEDGDFFEDILFVNTLEKKYPNKKFCFSKYKLGEKSNNFNDENSTWFYGQFDKHKIGDKTRTMLKEIKEDDKVYGINSYL